jgi:hypothetical protein
MPNRGVWHVAIQIILFPSATPKYATDAVDGVIWRQTVTLRHTRWEDDWMDVTGVVVQITGLYAATAARIVSEGH